MTESTSTTTSTDPNIQLNTQQTPAQPPAQTDPTALTPEQQKAFDKVIANRAKEAAEKARRDVLKELGIENVEDPEAVKTAKGRLTAAQQAEEAQKTEAQKLQDQINTLTKERDEEKQRAAAALAKAVSERVNGRIETLAKDARVQTPSDVVDYLEKHHLEDLQAVADADGKIDDKKAAALIETVKKARPHWFTPGTPGSPSFRDALPTTTVDKTRGTQSALNAIKKGGW